MNDRLPELVFLPPPTATPWRGWPTGLSGLSIKLGGGKAVEFDVPLFWYDPPWHRVSIEAADLVATMVAQSGIAVSALACDVSGDDTPAKLMTMFAAPTTDDGVSTANSSGQCELRPLPRILPYRAERFGVSPADFGGASVIDLRLTPVRDANGRFAYSADQVARWEGTSPESPLAGGSWIPAATFPPDVPELDQLGIKIDQLRAMSPGAAVMLAMSPYRMDDELAGVLALGADGIILRCDDLQLPGFELASMVRRARKWSKRQGCPEMPLWVVPGPVSPDDAVKLMQLGASAVAIDAWCEPIIDEIAELTSNSAAARLGYASLRSIDAKQVGGIVDGRLREAVQRVEGLRGALASLPADQRMATTHSGWAKPLGVRHLNFGG